MILPIINSNNLILIIIICFYIGVINYKNPWRIRDLTNKITKIFIRALKTFKIITKIDKVNIINK